MQAIATRYNNHLFRSRLEARWARFLDNIGARWMYEYEGYQTGTGRYLPDFWIPDAFVRGQKIGVLIEIKPDNFGGDHDHLEEVATKLHVGAILANGFQYKEKPGSFNGLFQITPFWEDNIDICVCEYCNAINFEFVETNFDKCPLCNKKHSNHAAEHVAWAYAEALRYRFW